MKLCLSARAFQGGRGTYTISIEALIGLARETGYDGITLRQGQLDQTTSDQEADRIRGLLEAAGMPCSFVTGIPAADDATLAALCRIVDRAALVGAPVVQPPVRDAAQVSWIQRAADYAATRGIALAPQLHNRSLHENVELAADLVDQVGRPNFGITFEASHLLLQDSALRDGAAVAALGQRIKSVCVQNYRLAPGEADAGQYEGHPFKSALPGDPRGVDLPGVFAALKQIGYDGFVTVMAGSHPGVENRDVFAQYARLLRPLL
jgi:sugar phosphate isomerase/epimerase